MSADRLTSSPPLNDPTTEVQAVLRRLTDRLFVLAVTLGVVAFGANTVRLALIGHSASYVVDALCFAVVLGVLSLRKRLPVTAVFWVLVTTVILQGVFNLATLGLASAAMMLLTAA